MMPVLYSHQLPPYAALQKAYCWETHATSPFNELLISWNAQRPQHGQYVISISTYTNEWSPWLLYAVWGTTIQYSFHETTPHAPVRTFQDQVELLNGHTATRFRIRVTACAGATLDGFYSLHACASLLNTPQALATYSPASSIHLSVSGLSQIKLQHPRAMSFCSPTSVTATLRYLQGNSTLNPLTFTQGVYDSGFDIYGNWSFNVAQAFVELGKDWRCWCARTNGLPSIWPYLKRGLPVVVSLKGSLTKSPIPYTSGHLVVIKGYDAAQREVLCMDPAFSSDNESSVAYPWDEFMKAWGERRGLAYFFSPHS